MSDETSIEWADTTWQPTSGCKRTSPGCGPARGKGGCYAERMAWRLAHNPAVPRYKDLVRMTDKGPRWTGAARVNEDLLLGPLHWKKPRRVFVDSMADLFFEKLSDGDIDLAFATMLASEVLSNQAKHIYQVLSKRSRRMRTYFEAGAEELLKRWAKAADGRVILDDPDVYFSEHIDAHCAALWDENGRAMTPVVPWSHPENLFPLRHVWLGVSVEDQERAEERLPDLTAIPAGVRWLSVEPLLGPVTFGVDPEATTNRFGLLSCPRCRGWGVVRRSGSINESGFADEMTCAHCKGSGCAVDWIVVGAESGPNARPMEREWVRAIRDEVTPIGVKLFYKQEKDAQGRKVSLPLLDGRQYVEMPDV